MELLKWVVIHFHIVITQFGLDTLKLLLKMVNWIVKIWKLQPYDFQLRCQSISTGWKINYLKKLKNMLLSITAISKHSTCWRKEVLVFKCLRKPMPLIYLYKFKIIKFSISSRKILVFKCLQKTNVSYISLWIQEHYQILCNGIIVIFQFYSKHLKNMLLCITVMSKHSATPVEEVLASSIFRKSMCLLHLFVNSRTLSSFLQQNQFSCSALVQVSEEHISLHNCNLQTSHSSS